MVGTRGIFVVVGIVVVLLVGSALGLLILNPVPTGRGASSATTSTTSILSVPNSTSIQSTTKKTTTGIITSNASNSAPNYRLQLVRNGSQPVLTSSLTSPIPRTQFGYDGLGGDCGGQKCYTYNYTDNGNNWLMQGDFEPGASFVNANSSGVTFSDQTCLSKGQPLKVCGPYWEWNGDKRFVNGKITGEENASELSSVLHDIPSAGQVFSIYLTLPYYNFETCEFNNSASGCSYEGYVPSISGVFALDVGSSNSSNSYSFAVSLSESCSTLSSNGECSSSSNVISVGIGTAAFVNGSYDSSLSKNFVPKVSSMPYSPTHKITLATDLKSFIEVWVDNTSEYSNTTVPIPQGDSRALNFYQFDNVDNMTLSTTWKNVTVLSNPAITVSGLQQGMTLNVIDGSALNTSSIPNATGVASLYVENDSTNLTVNVEQNGSIIASYTGTLSSGSQLKLETL